MDIKKQDIINAALANSFAQKQDNENFYSKFNHDYPETDPVVDALYKEYRELYIELSQEIIIKIATISKTPEEFKKNTLCTKIAHNYHLLPRL